MEKRSADEVSMSQKPALPHQVSQIHPQVWDGALVRNRLCEAFEIERRLPGSRHGSAAWPFPIVYSFADMVGRGTSTEPVRLRGATSAEIARMDEAMSWLRILSGYRDEQRYLAAWAASTGSVRLMCERRNIPRRTFYRRIMDGSERIANVLNHRGIAVR